MDRLITKLVTSAELARYTAAWDELAYCAVTPNVFYEPWVLLPAIEHIRDREDLRFLLVFTPGGEALVGFFPLEIQKRCLHLPVRTLAFWQHRYCYLTAPLVHADHLTGVLDAFWHWFEHNPLGCRVLDTNYLASDGPFHEAWSDFAMRRTMLVLNEHPRALQRRDTDFDAYSQLLSRERARTLRRSERLLGQEGKLEYVELENPAQLDRWMDDFLQLEASGWKRAAGTAIAVKPSDAAYFREMTRAAFARNRAALLSLLLDGKPVAMRHTLLCGDGAFLFKIAYDENYGKHSPGVLLELEHLRRWHSAPFPEWTDTGAAARHPMFNPISNERRIIRRALYSNGSRVSDLLVSTLPALRWASHVRKPAPPDATATPEVTLLQARDLPGHQQAWQDLADSALVPNVFYEPLMALPALEGESPEGLHFLLIWGPAPNKGHRPLWGFFPFQVQSRCLHLPLRNLAFWQHRYCYLTVPLVHRDHAAETLRAFWTWFRTNPLDCRILDTNWLLADGLFHAAWTEQAIGRTGMLMNEFPRALFRPSADWQSYLDGVVSHKSQNEFLRRERRLGDLGALEYRAVTSTDEAGQWADTFLELESAGWKGGDEGRAFAKHGPDAQYFRRLTVDAFSQGRCLLLSLLLDGHPIAMRHTLLAASGSYAFRAAYDERYAKHSPGLLLELETMRRIHADPAVQWMDSCAAPRHTLLNRIWSERRIVRRSLFSNGSRWGDLQVSLLPLPRWVKKVVRPPAAPEYLKVSTKFTEKDA